MVGIISAIAHKTQNKAIRSVFVRDTFPSKPGSLEVGKRMCVLVHDHSWIESIRSRSFVCVHIRKTHEKQRAAVTAVSTLLMTQPILLASFGFYRHFELVASSGVHTCVWRAS